MKAYFKGFVLTFQLVIIILLVVFNFRISTPTSRQVKVEKPTLQVLMGSPTRSFGDLLVTKAQVLSAQTQVASTPSPAPKEPLNKKTYLIAAIGDSMIETMGDSLEYLQASLKRKYPGTKFVMYNYGIGSENVNTGLARFDQPFKSGNKHYGPLSTLKPDILIVGSWAYNPLFPYDRNAHWLALAQVVNKAKKTKAQVYMLAEIAPLKNGFGRGVGGVNWPDNLVREHVPKIIEQLENAVGLAKELNVPLINAYDKTRDGSSKYGRAEFVSSHDAIHPSVYGQSFTADEIAAQILIK